MNRLDTLRMMIRHFPGGMEVVALRLGKAASTLDKELRAAPGYKLGMVDAEEISLMCIEAGSEHCHAYVNAVASRSGGFVELPVLDLRPAASLSASVAGLVKESSDVLQVALGAMEDGHISDNEKRAIDRELTELIEQFQAVRRGINARYEAGKAARGVMA